MTVDIEGKQCFPTPLYRWADSQRLSAQSSDQIFGDILGLELDFQSLGELREVGRNFFPHVYTFM